MTSMVAMVPQTVVLAQARAVARQSALEPGGPAAARIGELWDFMLVAGTLVTVATVGLLLYTLFRRRRPDELPPEADRAADPRGELANDESGGRGREDQGRPPSERVGARWMVIGGVAFPAVVLGVVLVLTLRTLGAVVVPAGAAADETPRPGALVIEVTGRQYWWQVRYLDATPANVFETANEIRLPVGRPALVRLRSDDVIHSFWVPGLQGKMDLIPTDAASDERDHVGVPGRRESDLRCWRLPHEGRRRRRSLQLGRARRDPSLASPVPPGARAVTAPWCAPRQRGASTAGRALCTAARDVRHALSPPRPGVSAPNREGTQHES